VKILVISHMYPYSDKDTYGLFVHNQVKALKAKGCEVKVVCPLPYAPFPLSLLKSKWKRYNSVPKKRIIDEIEVYYPRYLEFPKSMFPQHSGSFMYKGIRKVVKEIYQEFKFEIIHSHVLLPDSHAAMLLNKSYNVAQFSTVHGQDFQVTIHRSDKCKERLYEVINGSDGVVTVSTKLKNVIKKEDFREKIHVINNGINIEDCNIKEEAKEDRLVILSVSNLIKTKGIDLNIKALKRLVKKYPNILYRIIGGGPEMDKLKALADELSLKDNVEFTGRLPNQEVMKHMSSCQIFSLPSWEEGFGVVYIEAMAHGKPVIGVKGQGIEDVIKDGENGFLVNPKDPEDLARVLEYLFENEEKAVAIGEKGKLTVLNNFTWKHNAEKTISLYKNILSKRI